MMAALAGLIESATRIKPGEQRATLLSFLFVFTLMAAYYILRPVRDAMSSDWTDAELSTLWTLTFAFSAVAVALYGAVASVVRFRWLVPGVYVFFALSFAFFFAGVETGATHYADKAFYVWVSVFSLFHVSVFWSFMAELFSKQQAPRLFPFIAAGSSVGAIAGPAIAIAFVNVLGMRYLLLVSTAILICPIVLTLVLERDRSNLSQPSPATRERIGGNPFAGFTLFFRSPYLLGIGLFILLYTAISTFVYFELKNLMEPIDEARRVQVWAGIDLAVNTSAILLAMFGTSRIIERFGLPVTLSLVPIIIVTGLLAVAAAPLLWVVVLLQIVRRAGNYAITRPGREMLYTVVDRETRFKAKSVIDIVVYRGGDTLTAWTFTLLTTGLGLGLGAVAGVGAAIAAAWAVTAWLLASAYGGKNDPDRVTDAVSPVGKAAR